MQTTLLLDYFVSNGNERKMEKYVFILSPCDGLSKPINFIKSTWNSFGGVELYIRLIEKAPETSEPLHSDHYLVYAVVSYVCNTTLSCFTNVTNVQSESAFV